MKLSYTIPSCCLIMLSKEPFLEMNSVVVLQLRNWRAVKENRGQFTMRGTVFFIILHKDLLLTENECIIRG